MRGEILDFDEAAGTGLISGDDGLRYRFDRASLATPATVTRGLRVDFSPLGEDATQIMLLEAPAPAASSPWAQTSVPGTAPYPAATGPVGGTAGIDWVNLFFSFNGRIRRTHYWIGWAIVFVAGLVLGLVLGPFSFFVLLWPNLAIGAKRLHDMGHTGWLIAIPYVVYIGAVTWMISAIGVTALQSMADPSYAENMTPEDAMVLVGPMLGGFGLAGIVSLGFWLWMGIAESRRGDNEYGPNPKGEN